MKAIKMTIARYKQKKDILKHVSNKRREKEFWHESIRIMKEDPECIEMSKNDSFRFHEILYIAQIKAAKNLNIK